MPKTWRLKRDDLMTREEWLKLRRHLRERAELAERRRTRLAIRNEAIVVTAVATGMRRSELAGLDCGHLRLLNDNPFIVVRRGKGGKYRPYTPAPRAGFLRKHVAPATNR